MADRYLKQFPKTPDSNVVYLDGYVCLATDGSVATNPTGLLAFPLGTWVRTSTGKYTLTLADAWPSCLGVVLTPCNALTLTQIDWTVVACNVTADAIGAQAAKTIVVEFTTAGSVADLPKQAGFFATVKLKNSGLPSGS